MEFTKEEKKAIELLKKLQKKTPYIIWGDGTPYNKNNQIQTILNLIEKQQKEIEEKRIIIFAGAEKVKQLEKGNRSLMESRIKWKNRYYKEKKNYIFKDKINEKLKQINDEYRFYICEYGHRHDYRKINFEEIEKDTHGKSYDSVDELMNELEKD